MIVASAWYDAAYMMTRDKYAAVWTSYSSISDFQTCPRAYYLNNVYKDPVTRRKINLMTPAMALGHAVHNTIEPLANVPAEKRMEQPIQERFETEWSQVSGLQGGFRSKQEEADKYERGKAMIERVIQHPGPLTRKALRLPEGRNGMPPNFYLSEEENIVLCGKIDWLMYDEQADAVHIIDFKTGRHEENSDSLQLPIYLLLAERCQARSVAGAWYWYLDKSDVPEEKSLPDRDAASKRVHEAAVAIRDARQRNSFPCPSGGHCFACAPYERIVAGDATYIGVNDINQDTYVLLE